MQMPTDFLRQTSSMQGRLIPIDLKNLLQLQKKPIPWLVKDLLMLGRGHLLTGLGSSSKSTLLAMLSLSVATGAPTLPCLSVVETGSVVLALAENTPADAQQWLGELASELSLSESEVEQIQQKMHVFALAGRDATMLSTSRGKLGSTDLFHEFFEYCRSVPNIKLIGLDPAIAFTQGREIDEGHQRLLANLVENLAITTGACVVLISHAAKGSQYQTDIGSHVSRGSGALTDALRLEMLMKVMSPKEAKQYQIPENDCKSYVRLQVTKANRLPPDALKALWFKRGRAGVLEPVALKSTAIAKVQSDSERRLRQAANLLSTYSTSQNPAPFREWRERFADANLLTGTTSRAQEVSARRLLTSLLERGWAQQTSPGTWLVGPSWVAEQTSASCLT